MQDAVSGVDLQFAERHRLEIFRAAEPADGAAGEEVVHAGEKPAQYPWDAGTPS